MRIAEFSHYSIPIFEIFQQYFSLGEGGDKEICLTSLIEPDFDFIVGLQDKAETYGVFPNAGGIFDQPEKLIEMFDHIKMARLQYEATSLKEAERDMKTKTGR